MSVKNKNRKRIEESTSGKYFINRVVRSIHSLLSNLRIGNRRQPFLLQLVDGFLVFPGGYYKKYVTTI